MKKFFQRVLNAVKGFGFKQWFLLILNIVLVLGSIGCFWGLGRVSAALDSLTAADRFRGEGDTRFAQLACYLPVDDGKTEEAVFAFRQDLDAKMMEQSLEAQEGGRLYIDAYSGTARFLSVRTMPEAPR